MERRESEACPSQHSLSVEEAREGEDTQAGRRSILPAVPGHRASDELRKTSRAIPHSARALSWEAPEDGSVLVKRASQRASLS